MIRFVESMCNIFTPHDVFVMDVCDIEGEYFVVECNCFNGSGVYNNYFTESLTPSSAQKKRAI